MIGGVLGVFIYDWVFLIWVCRNILYGCNSKESKDFINVKMLKEIYVNEVFIVENLKL